VTPLDTFIEAVAVVTTDMPAPAIVDEDQALAHLRDILAADGLDLSDPTVARTALAVAYMAGQWAAIDPNIGGTVQSLGIVLARFNQAVTR
jgi:hypothetical protein